MLEIQEDLYNLHAKELQDLNIRIILLCVKLTAECPDYNIRQEEAHNGYIVYIYYPKNDRSIATSFSIGDKLEHQFDVFKEMYNNLELWG